RVLVVRAGTFGDGPLEAGGLAAAEARSDHRHERREAKHLGSMERSEHGGDLHFLGASGGGVNGFARAGGRRGPALPGSVVGATPVGGSLTGTAMPAGDSFVGATPPGHSLTGTAMPAGDSFVGDVKPGPPCSRTGTAIFAPTGWPGRFGEAPRS